MGRTIRWVEGSGHPVVARKECEGSGQLVVVSRKGWEKLCDVEQEFSLGTRVIQKFEKDGVSKQKMYFNGEVIE